MEDLISRQEAIDLFPNDDLEWDTNGGYIAPHLARQMICELPSAQPETHDKRMETHACVLIIRRAVEHLDWFTKLYCRDKSITDDLAFRCKQCEFAMPDGICLVKTMARKLCPDYKDFGAMGDL